jgi:hypothetical protein
MASQDNVAGRYTSQAKNSITDVSEFNKRKNFSSREVGLTHPDNSSFMRLTDSGDIEIFAAPGVGIVISSATRTISFFADNIRFHTREDGLKWNSMDFNYSADDFTEPTFLKSNPDNYNPAFTNISSIIDGLVSLIKQEEEQQDPQADVTISGNYLFSSSSSDITDDFGLQEETSSSSLFTEDQLRLMENDWKNFTNKNVLFNQFVDYTANLMQSGYTFAQAKEKAIRDKDV